MITRIHFRVTACLSAVFVFATVGWADEQVNLEAIAPGKSVKENAPGDVIVEPDLNDGAGFTVFFGPDEGQNIRSAQYAANGVVILDDNALRLIVRGSEVETDAFPVLCTNIEVQTDKGPETLDGCTTFVSLPDRTLRVFGSFKGKQLVNISYDLDDPQCSQPADWDPATQVGSRTCTGGRLVDDGAPPQASEGFYDGGEDASTRLGPAYYVTADKNRVFGYPIVLNESTKKFEETNGGSGTEIARVNGKNLTGGAAYTDNSIVVSDDSGLLYKIEKDSTGIWSTSLFGPGMTMQCLPEGRKTVQAYPMQADPDEVYLYVADRACGVIRKVNSTGTVEDTLYLSSTGTSDSEVEVLPSDIDVQIGISGSWDTCTVDNSTGFCRFDNTGAAGVAGLETAPNADLAFNALKFVLQDCRYESGTVPGGFACPLENCLIEPGQPGHDPRDCDLDVFQLAKYADTTGEFELRLPDPLQKGGLTRNIHADLTYPSPNSAGGLDFVDNFATFYMYYIDSRAAFLNVGTSSYDLDVIRNADPSLPNTSQDECLNPGTNFTIPEVNQTVNAVVHLDDFFNTVRCDSDLVRKPLVAGSLPDLGNCGSALDPDEFKPAFFTVRDCVNPQKLGAMRYSANVVGLQLRVEDKVAVGETVAVDTFLNYTALQYAELQAYKDQVLCNDAYTFPDLAGTNPDGAFLSQFDCDVLQSDLDDLEGKLNVCFDAALDTQGASAENCNATFAKIDNLVTVIETGIEWPTPADPFNPTPAEALTQLLNPRGEMLVRTQAFRFSLENHWLPSNSAPYLVVSANDLGESVELTSLAEDLEDDNDTLTGATQWFQDGTLLATGNSVAIEKAVGDQEVTAVVTDSDGISMSETVIVPGTGGP